MSASRLAEARKAVRPALKARMMLSGPSGAGKTRCSLIVATELAEGTPILGIDTEKESMLTYADDFDFTHLPWRAPYDAAELSTVITEAGEQYGVILIDSSSHFWRKEGGVLDIAGGKFTGWKEARPVQEALVEAILTCKAHVILGARSKVEHVQETEGGRQVVRKIGMAVQQDDDLEFELNVAIDLTMDHTATISKSRTTALPVGRAFKAGQIAEMAAIYRDWLKGGEPPAPKKDVDELTARMNALPVDAMRPCKAEFFAKFGRPEQLRESSVNEAGALVAGYENTAPAPEVPRSSPSSISEQPQEPTVPAATERKVTSKQAQRLHTIAGDLDETVLRVLIFSATNGQSDSASDVPDVKYDTVCAHVEAAKDGKLPNGYAEVADRYAAWVESHHDVPVAS